MIESWILNNLILIGFVSFVVLVILELLLRKRFPLAYFRYGIPVIQRNTPFSSPPKPFQIEEFHFEPVNGRPYIDIQHLDEFEYGLWFSKYKRRSQMRLANYRPLTRGYINFDEQNNGLKFLIYLNWYALLFLLLWFGVVLVMPPWPIKIILGAGGVFVIFVLYRREQEQYFEIWQRMCGEFGVTT